MVTSSRCLLALLLFGVFAGCGSATETAPVTVSREGDPGGSPPWESVTPLGRVPLLLEGAIVPRGADALLPGEPRETAVYAFKRDLALSAVTRIDISVPKEPMPTGELILHGPSSEPVAIDGLLVLATREIGRDKPKAPELLVLEPAETPRVRLRVPVELPLLGAATTEGDRVYFATGGPSDTVLGADVAPRVEAFRITRPADGTPNVEPIGGTPIPAYARAMAVHHGELVIVVTGTPPIWVLPLDPEGAPGPPRASFDYRIVQELKHGEFAFDPLPREVESLADRLLISDDNSPLVVLRLQPVPELLTRPVFDHRGGGGLLALLPGSGAEASDDRVYRARSTRVYVDEYRPSSEPVPLERWKLAIDGTMRAITLLPGLLVVADDIFGVYLFPR